MKKEVMQKAPMEILRITDEMLEDLFKPESLADKELVGITDEVLKEVFTQDPASAKVPEKTKADATNAFSGATISSVMPAKEARLTEKLEALCKNSSDAFVLRLFTIVSMEAEKRNLL